MLQDTSFAIMPDKEQDTVLMYHSIGDTHTISRQDNVWIFTCERGNVAVKFYREDILRVVMNPIHIPALKESVAIVGKPAQVEVQQEETQDEIILQTSVLSVRIQKAPFRINVYDVNGEPIILENEKGLGFKDNHEVICFKSMKADDHFYGFGEKTGFLDKKGEKISNWNTDVYAPHNPETVELYQSIPYFMTLRNGRAHGIYFDSTWKTKFDFQTYRDFYSFSAEGGQIDYYTLAGPTPKAVLEQYTFLTGRAPIPPKWAIGYHQSRYSYKTEQEVRLLAKTFKEKEIPLDAIHLDIHYMDGYRVFTFDRSRFPKPEKMVEELKQEGVHIVSIVDPGVKQDPEYHIYKEGIQNDYFCKYLEGEVFFGDVWPGRSAFPDFTNEKVREWWGQKHAYYVNMGIEGIWNDMNEPSVFNETKTMDMNVVHENDGDPRTHRELHNIYGMMMGKATYEGMKKQLDNKRPFLLTRAGFAGVQRYSAVWTGDNRSFWEHLELSLPMCMNLGVSGVPFVGPDVGGFAHDSNGQLLTRWTQVGAFYPFFRNHSVIESVRQEPWAFGEEYEQIIKRYIQLRYQWLPHLYSLFAEANETGVPIMRPLFLEYPDDPHVMNLATQFMVGDNVIVAPIMRPDTYHRVIYLPEGNWVDYWNEEVLEGGKHHLVEAPLDKLPIYVKQGTMLVHGDIKSSTAIPDEKLTLHIYAQTSGEASYSLYEDDGMSFDYEQGSYLRKTFHAHFENDVVLLSIINEVNGYTPSWKSIDIVVHGCNESTKLIVNGTELETTQLSHENGTMKTFLIV